LLETSTQGVANLTKYRGKKNITARVKLQQDYATNLVHDTVQAAIDSAGGVVACILKAKTAAAVSYTGDFAVGDYTSIPGGDGIAEIEISLEAAGAITLAAVV
jgi:hypothetical protein